MKNAALATTWQTFGLRFWLLASLVLMASCQTPSWWDPPTKNQGCDPSENAELKAHPLWNRTFGSSGAQAFGCIRLSWGTKDDEGVGLLVQISDKGEIKAYNPASTAFEESVTFTLPSFDKTRLRTFRLFLYGESNQFTKRETQEKYCKGSVAKPSYSCEAEPDGCWFSLAFRPKPAAGEFQTAPIQGAGDATCKLYPPTPPASEPKEEPSPNRADAAEGTPEPVAEPEPVQELVPETKPEQECTPTNTRPCFTETKGCTPEMGTFTCKGLCAAGTQTCGSDAKWGTCEGELGPVAEICDGKDNDCDGEIDEELTGCGACLHKCVLTIAGAKQPGFQNGKGTSSRFDTPGGVVKVGDSYIIADTANNQIRMYRLDKTIETLAGSSTLGSKDGTGQQAQFNRPHDVATDGKGNVYVADTENHTIRKIDSNGVVTTIAGSAGQPGAVGGDALKARFRFPRGLVVGPDGNIYVADTDNHIIRKINLGTMQVTVAAGDGTRGYIDDTINTARFDSPTGIAIDASGNIYIADTANYVIRQVDTTGKVITLAGIGLQGHADGDAITVAKFNRPVGLALGDVGQLFVADTYNLRIRLIDLVGKKVTTIAGSRTGGTTDGPADKAEFQLPRGIAFIPQSKELLLTDDHTLRIYTP